MSGSNNSGGGSPDHVELPDSAQRGQDINTCEVKDGKVHFACPVCERLVSAKIIVTRNECPGGHALDLVLLQGDSARRQVP